MFVIAVHPSNTEGLIGTHSTVSYHGTSWSYQDIFICLGRTYLRGLIIVFALSIPFDDLPSPDNFAIIIDVPIGRFDNWHDKHIQVATRLDYIEPCTGACSIWSIRELRHSFWSSLDAHSTLLTAVQTRTRWEYPCPDPDLDDLTTKFNIPRLLYY